MRLVDEVAAPVKVCMCYAREDDALRNELHAHMAPLERLGLIQSWYDKKIAAGNNWRDEIDVHLRDADVILLLISSSFIASNYCYQTEMTFAMKRHEEEDVLVIPILLRRVDFSGLPFAELQALPSDGKFVTGNSDSGAPDAPTLRDAAYSSLVKDLRTSIEALRRRRIQKYKERSGAEWMRQHRFLEAAVSDEIPKGESREVTALVSADGSEGLRFVLDQDGRLKEEERTFSSSVKDVRSSQFDLELPLTDQGFLRLPSLILKIVAPGFEPPEQKKRIPVPTLTDSKPYSFIIQGHQEGQHAINVELICDDVSIVEQLLRTRVVWHGGPDQKPPAGGIVVASVALEIACVAKASSASY